MVARNAISSVRNLKPLSRRRSRNRIGNWVSAGGKLSRADAILADLVQQQTDLFNRDAPEVERVAILLKIETRQKELSALKG